MSNEDDDGGVHSCNNCTKKDYTVITHHVLLPCAHSSAVYEVNDFSYSHKTYLKTTYIMFSDRLIKKVFWFHLSKLYYSFFLH